MKRKDILNRFIIIILIIRSDEYLRQELLIGTHTNDEEPNQVQILQVDLPIGEAGKGKKSTESINIYMIH